MKTLSKKLILSFALAFAFNSQAAVTIKVGVLAPEGTNWAKSLKKMAKEIKEKTDKQVKLKIYYGGSQGDEVDVLRKIRVGQLQGGIFTGKTLGEINGDVRVVELPFNFADDADKAWSAVEGMADFFNKGFSKAEFTNLGFFEIGMVYLISQKKSANLKSLSGVKVWVWEGDKLVETMVSSMKLVSVPLALPDVLSSLSTGIVEAAYGPPLGMIALQWNTKVKYLVDLPVAYSVGAFLIADKRWKKIKPEHQKIVKEISSRYIAEINKVNRKDNEDALKAMQSLGIEFLKFPESDIQKGKELRKEMIKSLKGPLFSEEAFKRLEKLL